MSTAIKHI